MNLHTLQRKMWDAVSQPLTPNETMRPWTLEGESTHSLAQSIIKPNDRLTSVERLEIYNRQYWFRILSSFQEDFSGLREIVGHTHFAALAQAYLTAYPSRSFTLRNLGSQLETWLHSNPTWILSHERLALDMVRLEWAEIAAFDAREEATLLPADMQQLEPTTTLRLQPHLQLLDLQYPVDDLLIAIRKADDANDPKRIDIKRACYKKSQPIHLVVYRSGFSIYFKRVERGAFLILKALQSGNSLPRSLAIAFSENKDKSIGGPQQIQTWFKEWSQLGWLCPSNVLQLKVREP